MQQPQAKEACYEVAEAEHKHLCTLNRKSMHLYTSRTSESMLLHRYITHLECL